MLMMAKNWRRRTKGGSGPGRATARSIVTAHDGNITAESKCGDGTRLMIRLPMSPVLALEVEPAPSMRRIARRQSGRGDHLTISQAFPQKLQKRWTGIIAAEAPINRWQEEADVGSSQCTADDRRAG